MREMMKRSINYKRKLEFLENRLACTWPKKYKLPMTMSNCNINNTTTTTIQRMIIIITRTDSLKTNSLTIKMMAMEPISSKGVILTTIPILEMTFNLLIKTKMDLVITTIKVLANFEQNMFFINNNTPFLYDRRENLSIKQIHRQ